ncbi:MAG: hypothetical protein IPK82_17825 [Polyangiaceae bacterium]|nr:hypothetical protein [Polyangiaceae bacterium]
MANTPSGFSAEIGKSVFRGVALGTLVLALLANWGARKGWVHIPLPQIPNGVPWFTSRALGFTAYAALTLDVIVGLLLSTTLGDRLVSRARALDLHRFVSVSALALTALHAVMLLADTYVVFTPIDLLVPFASTYRPAAVGAGSIALYTALLVHVSFDLQKRIGTRVWRALHALSFVSYVAATFHGLSAGTSSSQGFAKMVYGSSLALVMWLVFYRLSALSKVQTAPAGLRRESA